MTLYNALLVGAIVGEVAVLSLLLRHKAWRTLPVFSAYVAWCLASDVVNYVILQRFPNSFNLAYFIELGPDSILQLAVLIELAWSVLRPSRAFLPRGTLLVLSILVALAGLLIWPLAVMTMPPNLSAHAQLYVHFQQTIAILRVVCFLIMAALSQILSIGWKDRELQVATGLGFYSIISLLIAVLHSRQQWQDPSYGWLDYAATASYLGSLTYWILSFATKEQERKEFSPQMQQLLVLMGGGARDSRIALSDLPSEGQRKRNK